MSSGLRLPFAHLNLRCNPFGELPLPVRAELAVVEVEPWLRLLAEPPFVLQFIGESGRGKTTHLLALLRHCPGAPYVHIPEDEPAPLPLPEAPIVFVDETQRLSGRVRRRLFRRSRALVVGTHQNHRRELRRLQIPHTSVAVNAIPPLRLQRVLQRRIDWARRGPGPVPTLVPQHVHSLIRMYKDDVRAMEHYLYEVFQRMHDLDQIRL